MFLALQRCWEAGLEGLLIEEMISGAFSDFAPYAGAEQRQVRFVRQQTDGTKTSFVYEEDDEWAVNVENRHVGAVAFSTRREVVCDLRARLPLRLGSAENTKNDNDKTGETDNGAEIIYASPPQIRDNQRRFISSAALPSRGRPGTVGVLEVLFSPAVERYGVGLRVGPFSLRTTAGFPQSEGKESFNSTQTDKLRRAPLLIDGSCCMPIWSVPPSFIAKVFPSSLCLSLALQHPMGSAEGDTLGSFCIHSKPSECYYDTFRFLVVQTLMSGSRLLQSADESTRGRSTLFLGDVSWRDLGTLVGVSKSFGHGLLRLSASSMMHDGEVDYEAAMVVDATPVVAKQTQLKFGINKVGRIGVGITTKIFDDLLLTLGVHHLRGADTRFGLEMAM
ncbi:hypothetical protein TraAM80_07838 [Trypanosoma rangeli]|uniref:Mitochondrial import receptor subunit TOM40 n=1 Tax=Trypanosoma rangeli TaxID=5698 RepID=A0A422N3P4_TRYRA|nr:uncharacterized protein TraAM80_07838 [Trypanosoma rangeli]RNF00064.1 hypothetical protein TraAM80_07838 [Trypanosoma rangeli]|eukprot:RNF00064.1 hypothetical protein TraAM80_07838 [Trypanosoma rangeli]